MDVFGLIGNPVGHSLSPAMHEAAYEKLDMDARYVTFSPEPSALERALDGAGALGIVGLNVTVPFKETVCEYLETDDLAGRIGAVNTVDVGAGTGHNTDAAGIVRALREHDVALDGTAVVVGAGGAGRAATFALADQGMTVRVANRTVARAERLVTAGPAASAHGLDEAPGLLDAADLLVNATSVGMEEDATPVPTDALHADLAVLDAVYRPLETSLLRAANRVGATTVDGGWMLLYQGVEAFELWTGRAAPVATMNDALRTRV